MAQRAIGIFELKGRYPQDAFGYRRRREIMVPQTLAGHIPREQRRLGGLRFGETERLAGLFLQSRMHSRL